MTTKLLLIDDDQETTSVLGLMLNKHGFEVIKTNSSLRGIQMIQEHKPEVVLLDVAMLELDGWQVYKEINMVSPVPIIIFSTLIEKWS